MQEEIRPEIWMKWVVEQGVSVIGAVVVLIVGWLIINYFAKFLRKRFVKQELDKSLEVFLVSLTKIVLRIGLIISVASMVGIQTTSFIAVLGAASLAVGLALQGTLQNFAGGVIILMIKPFRTGDFVEVNGQSGTVMQISIFYTHLKTPDNRIVLLPNGSVSNAQLVNFTKEKIRRVELKIGISYGNDVKKARSLVLSMLQEDERVMQDPAPTINLAGLGDNSVDLQIRFWSKIEDFWPLFFQIQERIYEEFPPEGLEFPFPQLDVHMQKDS